MLKGEVGQRGPPGPTLFVQPPDLTLYKGEKVSPTYRLGHLVKQDWETFRVQVQGWPALHHHMNLKAASVAWSSC